MYCFDIIFASVSAKFIGVVKEGFFECPCRLLAVVKFVGKKEKQYLHTLHQRFELGKHNYTFKGYKR